MRNFTKQRNKFWLNLHYNEVNSYIFANGVEIYKLISITLFPKINAVPLCLGDTSKYFLADNMKNTGLYGYVFDFSVDYDSIDVNGISYIFASI